MEVFLVEQGWPAIQQLNPVHLFGTDEYRRTYQVEHVVDVAALPHRYRHKQVVSQDSQDGTQQQPAYGFVDGDLFYVTVRVPEGNRQAEGVGVGNAQENRGDGVWRQSEPEGRVWHGQIPVVPAVQIPGLALFHQLPIPNQIQPNVVHQWQRQLQYPVRAGG